VRVAHFASAFKYINDVTPDWISQDIQRLPAAQNTGRR